MIILPAHLDWCATHNEVHAKSATCPRCPPPPHHHSAFWCMHCNDVFCDSCDETLSPAGADYDCEVKTGVRWCSKPECVEHEAESRMRNGRKAPRAEGA